MIGVFLVAFTSINDLYFVAVGLLSYNILFDVIMDTGIIYIPFIYVIIESFGKGMESSRNMSDSIFTLKSLETKIYSMLLVFMLCFYPAMKFYTDTDVVQYARACDDSGERVVETRQVGRGQLNVTTGTSQGLGESLISISNLEMKIPVMLNMALTLGIGTSLKAVKELPCSINLTAVSDELMKARIDDGGLLLETKAFLNQCYSKGLNVANMSGAALPWNEDVHEGVFYNSTSPWPGHEYFLVDGIYGDVRGGFQSRVGLKGFQGSEHNKNITEWAKSKQLAEENPNKCSGDCYHETVGFPSCKEWWNGLGNAVNSSEESLRARLVAKAQENTSLVRSMGRVERAYMANQPARVKEDKLIELAFFNSAALDSIKNAETRDYGSQVEGVWSNILAAGTKLVGTVGAVVTSAEDLVIARMVQTIAPLAKGIFLFALIAIFPLMAIVSNLGMKITIQFYMFVFSVCMWPYFWELAIMVQQSYGREVFGETGLGALTEPNITLFMYKMTDVLFILFPSIFTMALAAAGLGIGTQMSSSMGNMDGSSQAKGAGKSGGKATGKTVNKGASAAKKAKTGGAAK